MFSPEGRILAVGSEEEYVRLWDLETGQVLFRLVNAVNVKALVFSPDGNTLATACQEPIIRFWDTKTGQEKTSYRDDIGKVSLLAYSPDGTTLASWSDLQIGVQRILLLNVASGTRKAPLSPPPTANFFHSIGFSRDGQTLAVTHGKPNGVDLWNLKTRREQFVAVGPTDAKIDDGSVGEVFFCSDGRRLAFYHEETAIRLWDLDKQKEQSSFPVANKAKFPTATLRADGKLAAIGDGRGIISLWNTETGEKVTEIQASRHHVPFAYFSPDGRTMATRDILESAVKIWDVPTLLEQSK
ncbi:hypothetical protein KIH39_08500 [Telmatocola sphagniphila]|uniref:WD40 repeat domain-containing protein n=1 Tax=Telmatocola sphagniphila TaxID=1123043 RepID=A0A8E6B9M9_9BACT|nr:hypothetical protein KIH39_08500 [Telmatocola sphagniphila]